VKISVLAFDLANNATGRADLLARLLAPRWQVEVVGPQFGAELWKPSQGGDVTHRALEAGNYPGFLSLIPGLVALVDGDVIVASKPRPTSYGVGLLARARRRRPLLLDIDDWEVGFFYRSGGSPTRASWPRASSRLASAARSSRMCATPRPGTRRATTRRGRARRSEPAAGVS
jgi:hypothetical protein